MEKVMIALCLLSLISTYADAANRTGSHREGGTNSHGKNSHYVGGHK